MSEKTYLTLMANSEIIGADKTAHRVPKKYQVIYADPPWAYGCSNAPAASRPCLTRGEKPHSVTHYYKTMPTKDICLLPIRDISEKDAVLFLWATNPFLPDAFDVMKSWGFAYKTLFTWHKDRCKGMGYWFRGHTEHILLGVRGKVCAFRSLQHNVKKLPVEKHSKKPDWFRSMIEGVTPNATRIELFARQRVKVWDAWGNEIEIQE